LDNGKKVFVKPPDRAKLSENEVPDTECPEIQ
jgi:hypothetical protein